MPTLPPGCGPPGPACSSSGYFEGFGEGATAVRARFAPGRCAGRHSIVTACASQARTAREAGVSLLCVRLREQAQRGHCLVPRRGSHWRAWHSGQDKCMYPVTPFIPCACYVPETVLGAGDTKMKAWSSLKPSGILDEGTGLVKRAVARGCRRETRSFRPWRQTRRMPGC